MKKCDSARLTAPPKKNPIANASAWTIAYVSSDLANASMVENKNTIAIKHPVITTNDHNRFPDILTETILPSIAPIDEKIRRSDDAELDLSKNSLE